VRVAARALRFRFIDTYGYDYRRLIAATFAAYARGAGVAAPCRQSAASLQMRVTPVIAISRHDADALRLRRHARLLLPYAKIRFMLMRHE